MKDIERMVVSAHEDGEVESPWKEAVERRIAGDAEWSAEAALHRNVKAALAASPEPDWTHAAARVKAAVEAGGRSPVPVRTLPLRWVSIAAALLLVAGGAGFWLGRQTVAVSTPAAVAELKVQVPKALGLTLSGEGQLLMASTLQGSRR